MRYKGVVREFALLFIAHRHRKGSDMPIDYSNLKPDDFLPKFGTTCPNMEDLQTGDLLFPRLPTSKKTGTKNSVSSLLQKKIQGNTELFERGRTLKQIFGDSKTKELLAKADNPKLANLRSLDITVAIADILIEKAKKTLPPIGGEKIKFGNNLNKKIKLLNNHNSLYASHDGMRILSELLDPNKLQTEGLGGSSLEDILTDVRVLELIMQILIASGFGGLIKNWFNATMPITLIDFMMDPLIQLLFDLLVADDVKGSVFIGHVGMVIREKDGKHTNTIEGSNVYVINANITSYSHYRVAMHPYYVKDDNINISVYFDKHYNKKILNKFDDETDFDWPAENAAGWANRRIALLENIWHARPSSDFQKALGEEWQNGLIKAAKEMHGRPYGFFDHSDLGEDDRMYCSEYIYNIFRRGISQAAANTLKEKMTWGMVKQSMVNDGNTTMADFIQNILDKDEIYHKVKTDEFFVFQPAILWNSPGLTHPFRPGDDEYAPLLRA